MWKKVINEIESTKIAEALGLISTILGTGKESLALAYVALASKRKAKSLNLTQLFKGV
jgi:hypothetical protein